MIDLKIYQDRISSIEANLKIARGNKELFLKAQGLDEQAAKQQKALAEAEEVAAKQKEKRKAVIAEKNEAVATVLKVVMEKMDAVLPAGQSDLAVSEDGAFSIGWRAPGASTTVAYSGLSGGEKVAFDQALVKALGGTILIVEGAEMDPVRLAEALRAYQKTGLQVIVSSCHEPKDIPAAWEVVRL